ncbi:MAG: DinB family protein [Vicinamibacterales bacterium]|jgi:hypothetical protein|nr:damage-inducible protein DinB [Acidobacteriota bacterium]MDP7470792.1 DinB family protein [Vicinamibacterales bacterium]MDP7670433.1 DinB family protein [Vicinamibacterales bacterium]HJO38091.1 DinB family protein [Vicinamibacterales bacterium]|tara:strand:- start:1086 stop:1613 length:528 start_codon:yes stop_codon:yes gene_type:complete
MMTNWRAQRPADGEHAPFYTGYLAKLPDGDILDTLSAQRANVIETLSAIPPDKRRYRYAPDKWSVMEMLRHMIDTEWVFSYRALWIARADQSPLPDMDQAAFVANTDVSNQHLDEWIEEFGDLRSASLRLFGSFDEEVFSRVGTSSGNRTTVRALIWISAGHVAHHLDVLRERYL